MMVCQSAPPASAPEPRLTARSMLSVGTELLRAFWIASYSVGLPSGSPPPVRAATSIFLINFAKSLPRLASTTAFLCLVVAHFEWPLIPALSRLPVSPACAHPGPTRPLDHLREELVHAMITGQLRMKRGGQHGPLPDRHDPTGGAAGGWDVGHPGQHLDASTGLFHPRGPD